MQVGVVDMGMPGCCFLCDVCWMLCNWSSGHACLSCLPCETPPMRGCCGGLRSGAVVWQGWRKPVPVCRVQGRWAMRRLGRAVGCAPACSRMLPWQRGGAGHSQQYAATMEMIGPRTRAAMDETDKALPLLTDAHLSGGRATSHRQRVPSTLTAQAKYVLERSGCTGLSG